MKSCFIICSDNKCLTHQDSRTSHYLCELVGELKRFSFCPSSEAGLKTCALPGSLNQFTYMTHMMTGVCVFLAIYHVHSFAPGIIEQF